MEFSADDSRHMARAIELAKQGEGFVEPNPMVGAVVVRDGKVVGEGWHRRFGDLHAEAEAIRAAGDQARGATLYVTLEPCCHAGKQPPCSDRVIAAGVTRVVAAMQDPFPKVAGGGFQQLRQAGVQVEVGLHDQAGRDLIAPFSKLVTTGRPWVIAKWAMTLDGKLATSTGDSRWISSEASRAVVHQLRSRMDAIIVGGRTAQLDDPLLTARLPSGEKPARVATRIILDSEARLSLQCQLVKTASQAPVVIAVGPAADLSATSKLQSAGCEVLRLPGESSTERLPQLLEVLGQRQMTNLLVEGGSQLLGSLFDAELVDEVHAFVAPKIVGGTQAPSPVHGSGSARMSEALQLTSLNQQWIDGDAYFRGRIARTQRSTGPS